MERINGTYRPEGGRIGYIDAAKGLVMVLVVLVHTHTPPQWISATAVNSAFFMMAGVLFRRGAGFGAFLKKKVRRIVVPFLYFFLFSYLFWMFVTVWDGQPLRNYPWDRILNVVRMFYQKPALDGAYVLWFLVEIFEIYLAYYFIDALARRWRWALALLCIAAGPWTWYLPLPLYLSGFTFYLGMFMLGNLLQGRFFAMERRGSRGVLLPGALLAVYAALMWTVLRFEVSMYEYRYVEVALVCSFCGAVYFGSHLLDCRGAAGRALRWIGRSSMGYIGYQQAVLFFTERLVGKFPGIEGFGRNLAVLAVGLAVCAVLTALTRRIAPRLIGETGQRGYNP